MKPILPGQRRVPKIECSVGRFFSTLPLRNVLQWIYSNEYAEISGAGSWQDLAEKAFELQAVSDAPLDASQCKTAVQELLRDRFNLRTHTEIKEKPIYALVAAKSGFKLRAPPLDTSDSQIGVFFNGHPVRYAPKGISIHDLAPLIQLNLMLIARVQNLGEALPVVDRTGLTGKYEIRLDFAMAPQDPLPDFFTALQEQLGLKLERSTDLLKVLVIDAIRAPDEN